MVAEGFLCDGVEVDAEGFDDLREASVYFFDLFKVVVGKYFVVNKDDHVQHRPCDFKVIKIERERPIGVNTMPWVSRIIRLHQPYHLLPNRA